MDTFSSSVKEPGLRLRFEKLTTTNVRNAMSEGTSDGSVHLVGNRIYSFGKDRSIAYWTFGEQNWHQLPSTGSGSYSGAPSNHSGDLGGDKIFLFGRFYERSVLVEFDLVLEEVSRLECTCPAALNNITWMRAAYSAARKEILFVGGMIENLQQDPPNNSTISCLNVETKSWSEIHMKGELPSSRIGQAVTIRGFELFSYGGYNKHHQQLNDLWVAHLGPFAPAYWTEVKTKSRVPTPHAFASLNFLGDKLIMCCGYSDNETKTESIEVFFPKTAEWKCAKASNSRELQEPGDVELLEEATLRSRIGSSVQTHDSIIYLNTRSIFRLSLNA